MRFLVLLLDRSWARERVIRGRWRDEPQPGRSHGQPTPDGRYGGTSCGMRQREVVGIGEESRIRTWPAPLLTSQLRTLEPPGDAIAVDITPSPEAVAVEVRRRLGL